MNSNTILMLGLPETGKTTYLAALAYSLTTNIESINLTQYQLSSNSGYINNIMQNWLKGKAQERTKVASTKSLKTEANMFIQDKRKGKQFTLHIPDFHGEIFETQFTDRYFEASYIEHLQSVSGAVLFIHPGKLKNAVLIEDIIPAKKIAALVNSEASNESGDFSNSTEIEQFKREEIPTQVILSDLVEAHLEFIGKKPFNLAVVVSAWDVIIADAQDLSPLRWIERALPLFYQYLIANNDRLNFSCFGVSALGGDIEIPEVAEKLMEISEPSERIKVQENDQKSNNIGLPIEWIIQQWEINK